MLYTKYVSGASWLASMYLLIVASSALAVTPDSGWYFNTNESGRGFSIEIQNNVLFMAGFVYDTAGKPIWVVSGGPMSSDHTYSGAAFQTANGQSLGGGYHAATSVPFGTAVITFPTTTTASITVNGYGFTVTRQIFGFDFTSRAQPLLGEFAFVEGIDGLYFGSRVIFTGTSASTTDGTPYATGYATADTSRAAVGQYSPTSQQWSILLDSSPSYYKLFTFSFSGLNFVEGDTSTFLKGASPVGSLPTVGYRTKSAQAAAGLNAPGSFKAAVVGTDSYSAATAAVQDTKPFDQSRVEIFRSLENMLDTTRQ